MHGKVESVFVRVNLMSWSGLDCGVLESKVFLACCFVRFILSSGRGSSLTRSFIIFLVKGSGRGRPPRCLGARPFT